MKPNVLTNFVGNPKSSSNEHYLLNALPLVRHIAASKLHGDYRHAVEDLVQTIGLNLWRWQSRLTGDNNPKSNALPPVAESGEQVPNVTFAQTGAAEAAEAEETKNRALDRESWLKIAATAARNEVSSFYASKYHREIPVERPDLLPVIDKYYDRYACNIEGETETEVNSLLAQIWGELQTLSLRRRYALLLNKDEFIDELIAGGVCTLTELARFFEMERGEFLETIENLPLPDARIAELVNEKTGEHVTIKQVWTWRAKAKIKLAQAITGKCAALLLLILTLIELIEL
jgi:hypothetical protein